MYYDVALLAQDTDFILRITACYTTETPLGEGEEPNFWASKHAWDMAGAPGFGDAYAYAVEGGNSNPGRDPAVITDEMILSAVQAVMTAEQPPPEE